MKYTIFVKVSIDPGIILVFGKTNDIGKHTASQIVDFKGVRSSVFSLHFAKQYCISMGKPRIIIGISI